MTVCSESNCLMKTLNINKNMYSVKFDVLVKTLVSKLLKRIGIMKNKLN